MVAEFQNKARDFFSRTFPERQVYLRSSGTVQYVSLKPLHQAMAVGGAAIIASWCVYASASVLMRGPAQSASQNEFERKVSKYERWLQQARAREAAALSLLEERSAVFANEAQDLERRHESLTRVLAALSGPESLDEAGLRGDGAGVLVKASLDEAEPRVSRSLVEPTARLETAGFRARIDTLRSSQDTVLDAVEELAVDRSERARGVLRLTGIGSGRLLEEVAQGGPLVEVSAAAMASASGMDPFSERVLQVSARLEEMRRLEKVLQATPLAATVGVPYRLTSGYGVRVDPFTKRPASHEGLDFAAYRGAPIISSSPGVVTIAERRAGYGNLVEIDHGFGFRTRYGHLDRVSVQSGAQVGMGTVIGTMGSTGRSTGPHLHYEVWFRGKTYDPINFLKAGKHVHETDQAE
jgi:murein DD-endopeptidase MepM/ murein hydrolase activator NlpD